MEPKTQVEIQLGHMCNNRCVFCVSGQETELGRARPLASEPILRSLSAAFAEGHRKVTLLGGEPTLQPAFREVALHAIRLGFEEIVVFTNGVKTARRSFIEDILETGGNFTWRISIQGATEEAHERTTRRPGSFRRILRSMEHLRDLGQKITINMCVVQSNFDSVGRFPEIVARYGASQLHLDMIRPMDAGARTDAEYRAMIPRYSDLVPALETLVAGTPSGFDLNIGNLPYCIAPHLARFIHHDGETTYTVAVDGDNALSAPWDKYAVKRRDKSKPASCRACVFDNRCNGVFDKYREIYGVSEFVPVTTSILAAAPSKHGISARLASVFRELAAWTPPPPFTSTTIDVLTEQEVAVTLSGPSPLRIVVREPGAGAASFDAFGVAVASLPQDKKAALLGLSALWARLTEFGFRVWHPLGGDAIHGAVTPRIAKRLARLRSTAPHGNAEWRSLVCDPTGRRTELELVSGEERAIFWIAEGETGVRAGYDLAAEKPGPALVGTLHAMMNVLAQRLPIADPDAKEGARP